MVEYAPSWDSMQPSHEMSIPQVRKSAVELANLLDESKNEQVLKEACLGLCQLFGEGIQNERIQAILEANVVPKLVALLKPSKSRNVPISVQSAALQVLGNVACGDDRQTQVVIDSDALPCLRSLLSSSDRGIRKEVCWIVSNITESSHQVQDVLDADILPPLLKLLDNQDTACREDATWVLFNLSSNRDPNQIAYLAEKNGVRALCNLLTCPKDLDVLWKGCGTVAAVALKGLRNILICGHSISSSDPNNPNGYNKMAALVAEAHGVERIEALTTHESLDVRNRARLILERMFGTEPTNHHHHHHHHHTHHHQNQHPQQLQQHNMNSNSNAANSSLTVQSSTSSSTTANLSSFSSPPPPPPLNNSNCSCPYQQDQPHQHHQHAHHSQNGTHYQTNGIYDINGNLATHTISSSHFASIGVEHSITSHHLHTNSDGDLVDRPGSTSGSSTDSDPEDDDSDSDLIPPPPAPCNCVLCTDSTPLVERRSRNNKSNSNTTSTIEDSEHLRHVGQNQQQGYEISSTSTKEIRQLCDFCSGGGRLGDSRAGLASKLGRAVRLGHPHCLAVLLSRMTWSQRIAATETPALLHPGGGPPDGGVGSSLPAVVLAAQLGKPECLALLLRKCRPDLDVTHGKKRLTALAWAAHKSYMRCCELLLEYGANTSTKCGDGVTALHLAASGGGHVTICKLLIDHNAPINAKSSKKQTPLCLASQKGCIKVVQLLLEYGADSNNEDEGKYTPLHLAASKGFEHCVNLLLKSGAKVDAVTRKSVTPLHYAVQGGHAAVVKSLISHGAQVNCTHKPLLLIAADDGNVEVVHILLDAQATIDCKANIRAMLDKETEVSDFLTPLHLAASKAHQEVVELLLSRGADVNEVTSKRGWSALDFAVLNGNADCAVTLLEHGAVVTDNCKTIGRNNWTLVQYAAHHGAKDVVRLLIQRLKEQRMGTSSVKTGEKSNATSSFQNSTNNNRVFTSDADDGVNGSYKPTSGELDDDGSQDVGTHPDYLEDDDGLEHVHEGGCPQHPHHHLHDGPNSSQPPHRYDPRSLEGDEVGFGTGPGYNNGAGPENIPSSKSRRRVVKEDRQNSIRAREMREMRKREVEASEARDRLEEAMNQRSVSKLTEAIQHVSKLVLHLATSVGGDANGGGVPGEHPDMNGYDSYSNNGGGNGSHVHHHHHQSTGNGGGGGNANESPNCSNGGFPAPLAMEAGLGIEVQKARKILAGLVAEEKRIKEEKEREAVDMKRESMQATVKKAITAALQGGDPRSLSRAISRGIRTLLDKDEEIIIQAQTVGDLISNLEKCYAGIKTAMRDNKLEQLTSLLPRTNDLLTDLQRRGGDAASQRVFNGGDPKKLMNEAERLKKELKEKQELEKEEERRLKDLEHRARVKLEEAMDSNNIVELEKATKEAAEALLTKDSELGLTVESAKKVLTKWVKGERRKLKQARNSNNPERIEDTANAAAELGLQALQSDIDGAREHAQKLREQADAIEKLDDAIAKADAKALNDIRNRLTKLGMFSEADKARSEAERLQKAKRARKLLDESIKEATKAHDEVVAALSEECLDADVIEIEAGKDGTSRATSGRSDDEILEELMTWNWPNAQKLHELSKRAKQYGDSSAALCKTADDLLKELSQLGRRVLEVCTKSSDARAIAAMIAGYEKSFMAVATPEVFGKEAGKIAISEAKERLAIVQAMDQESVKAESAQVKVEYAIATSRRSVAAQMRNTTKVGSSHSSSSNANTSNRRPTHNQVVTGEATGGFGRGQGRLGGGASQQHQVTHRDVHQQQPLHSAHHNINPQPHSISHSLPHRAQHHDHHHSNSHSSRFHSPRTMPGGPVNYSTIAAGGGDRNGVPGNIEGQSLSSMSSDCGDEETTESDINSSHNNSSNNPGMINTSTSLSSGMANIMPGMILQNHHQSDSMNNPTSSMMDSNALSRSHDGMSGYRSPIIVQKKGRSSNMVGAGMNSTPHHMNPTTMPMGTNTSATATNGMPIPLPIPMPLHLHGGSNSMNAAAMGGGGYANEELNAIAAAINSGSDLMGVVGGAAAGGNITPRSGDANNNSSIILDPSISSSIAAAGNMSTSRSIDNDEFTNNRNVHPQTNHTAHNAHPHNQSHYFIPSSMTVSPNANTNHMAGLHLGNEGPGGNRSSGLGSDYLGLGRASPTSTPSMNSTNASNTTSNKRRLPSMSMVSGGSGGPSNELSGLTFGGSVGLSTNDLMSGTSSPVAVGGAGGIGHNHLHGLNDLSSLVDHHGRYGAGNLGMNLNVPQAHATGVNPSQQPKSSRQQATSTNNSIPGPFSTISGLGGVGVSNAMNNTSLSMMMPSTMLSGGGNSSISTSTTTGQMNLDGHHHNNHHNHHHHHRTRPNQQHGNGNGRGRGRTHIGLMNASTNGSSATANANATNANTNVADGLGDIGGGIFATTNTNTGGANHIGPDNNNNNNNNNNNSNNNNTHNSTSNNVVGSGLNSSSHNNHNHNHATTDLGLDFENENFGFDINSIVDDPLLPGTGDDDDDDVNLAGRRPHHHHHIGGLDNNNNNLATTSNASRTDDIFNTTGTSSSTGTGTGTGGDIRDIDDGGGGGVGDNLNSPRNRMFGR